MAKLNNVGYDSSAPSEKPSKSWADFADNFLFWFFEGQSFPIWIFVSGLLIVLYGKYAIFPDSLIGRIWFERVSLILLFLLIVSTLYKNFIFSNPFGLGDKLRILIKLNQTYRLRKWFAEVLGIESRKLNLPVKIVNFRKIYAKVKVIDAGDGRWRAGFVFENKDGTREYIFHAYQDAGSPEFRSKIVERQPGVEHIKEEDKTIGVKDPLSFDFWVENSNGKLDFYIDGIPAKSYKVPIQNISDIIIAAWSDAKPIKILFEDIEVLV